MATLTITTTELVDRILEECDATSQRRVAEALHVSPSTITNWRRGTKMDLDWPLFVRLQKLLNETDHRIIELHFGHPVTGEVASEEMLSATVGDSGAELDRLAAVFTLGTGTQLPLTPQTDNLVVEDDAA